MTQFCEHWHERDALKNNWAMPRRRRTHLICPMLNSSAYLLISFRGPRNDENDAPRVRTENRKIFGITKIILSHFDMANVLFVMHFFLNREF